MNQNLQKDVLENILFQIHLAFWISYYKAFPTKNLIVKTWFLSQTQIDFWKKFYLNGLWEFFVENNFDPKGILNFQNTHYQSSPITLLKSYFLKKKFDTAIIKGKNLLLFWGWKDSLVSYHFIQNTDFDPFVFGKLDTIKKDTLQEIGENPLLVTRQISPRLFELNTQGYFNGHVPITWMIAFVTLMCSYLYGYNNIILSNEKSSSEENMWWKEMKINHQYSKSFEFEKDFFAYTQHYISRKFQYFSLLRGMYEYKIASIFAHQKEFFHLFSSCNTNFKILW